MERLQESETRGAQTLRRGLTILKLLARNQPAGLRVSDIGRRASLNKATAVRLTRTLVEERFVTFDPSTRKYSLGPETFAVGLAAEPAYALQRLAAPFLRSLALETGDWVFFSVKQGFEAICLSRESGDIPYPASALKIGDCHPLCIGAGGIAILAALTDQEIEQAIIAGESTMTNHYPEVSVSMVQTMVRETREKGYSVIPGTIVRGYWGLGVPLLQKDGRPVAAIVLVTSEKRLNSTRQVALGERMRRLAAELMSGEIHNSYSTT
jgi:DNA-binding IclR family transcriptional regulator